MFSTPCHLSSGTGASFSSAIPTRNSPPSAFANATANFCIAFPETEDDFFSKSFTSAKTLEHSGFRFTNNEKDFNIQAKLESKRVLKIDNFRIWLNENLSVKIKEFLGKLREGLADRKLDDAEKSEIAAVIDEIIYTLVIIHLKLKVGQIEV